MEKLGLFRALLNKEFYQQFTHKLSKELFPEELWDLFDSLEQAHLSALGNLKPVDLWEKHKELNPTLTTSQKQAIYQLIDNIRITEKLDEYIAKDSLNRALVEDKATRLAQVCLEISHGKHEDWSKIQSILEEDVTKDEVDYISTNLDDLMKEISSTYKYRFNLSDLDKAVGPIGPEVLCILAANVNAGKTLSGISFTFGPKGFLEQGAKVLYIGNEESLKRTVLRGASAYFGVPKDELHKIDKATEKFNKLTENFYPIDDVAMNFNKLNHEVAKLKPDIVILDMLDNIAVTGNFQRGDEKLGRIYQSARELAKRHKCAVIGLSQTNAESTGKLYVGFDKLAGSKVDKAAAADLILILGSLSEDTMGDANSNFRVINVAKSKLEGNGAKINCQIIPHLSRLVA